MKKMLLISLTLLILASGGVASTLCTNNVGLDPYIANYAGINNACQIGDKLFYDFAYSPSSTPAGNQPAANETSVIPAPRVGFPNPGIIFSAAGVVAFPTHTID